MRPPHPAPEAAPLRGKRVLLRRWAAGDRAAFAALNADPEVMQQFPAMLSRAQSDVLADGIEAHFAHFAQFGFGPWALEIPGVTAMAGLVGLRHVSFDAHFTPAVEISWRLARPYCGQGYALEAAQCACGMVSMRCSCPRSSPSRCRPTCVRRRSCAASA